jgi:hypothetical protein
LSEKAVEYAMKALSFLFLLMNLVSVTAYAEPSSDQAIWDALSGIQPEQLPTAPGFVLGEKKQAGRLSCSHVQQSGQPETFNCSLQPAQEGTDDRAIWEALVGVPVEQIPTVPGFTIGEKKEVGLLMCSHLEQMGQPETFSCFM